MALIIGNPVFPAAKCYANPFESQRSRRRMVILALGLDHRPIPNGRNGLANREDAALDECFIPTVVLAEEASQLRRRNFL